MNIRGKTEKNNPRCEYFVFFHARILPFEPVKGLLLERFWDDKGQHKTFNRCPHGFKDYLDFSY